ncbi:MAG: hypothetical protein JWQ76_2439 [Ramlibacter sp.]|nr:hypothetical protein [Ramlibacter sp.]
MHARLLFLIPLGFVAALGAQRARSEEGLSRAQAQASFDATIRPGHLLALGEPSSSPKPPPTPAEPTRPTDILAADGLSPRLNEFYAERYRDERTPARRDPGHEAQRGLLSRRF